MSLIFILSGFANIPQFKQSVAGLHQAGWPAAAFFIALSTAIEIGCGLLLLTGYKARYAALVLAAWLIPVTLTFHNFWTYSGAEQHGQLIHFLKNLAIFGGLLVIASSATGAGRGRGESLSASKGEIQ
jgi:putative oxidoreductase